MSNYYRNWNSRPRRRQIGYSPSQKKKGIFALPGRGVKKFFSIRGFWKKAFTLAVFAAILMFISAGLLFAYYSFNLPDPSRLADRVIPESTKIMDRNGELLYEVHGDVQRTLVPLEEIPDHVKDTFIAIEDRNFYEHRGISFRGIARAVFINLFTKESPGGSTITQQFVRNAVLSREKTFTRKFKEIILSLQLENKYTKDEILQLYLNEIPFGSTLYGIQAASASFFGKDVRDLTVTESAYLASLPQSPTYYSPYGPNREVLDSRADTVIQLMYEQGYIDLETRNSAQNTEAEFKPIGRGIIAPHFVLYVQDLLAREYGEITLQEGGLRVTTTLDKNLQDIAEQAVANWGERNQTQYNASNASLVAIDPKTGQILAMVGSRDYFNEEIDGAVNVALRSRQPGSSFKPYVYSSAFLQGMNPATMLMDVVTNFGEFGGREYVPVNYNGREYGPLSIRTALQNSLNIPAVKTILLTGVDNAIDVAENLGITTLNDRSRYGPSLVLGAGEVRLLEHTAAYGVFAAGGIKRDTAAILEVRDKNGDLLREYRESRGEEVLDPRVAYQINHVLSDIQARSLAIGTANKLVLPGRTVAAKTGTTQESKDAWTIGYTPSLVAGVWAGNNDNTSTRGGGLTLAAPIWHDFMAGALEGKPNEGFERPEGIVELEVDALSGKLPGPDTRQTKTEIFASFNVPMEIDDTHVGPYTILRSEKPNDPAWEIPVWQWAEKNGYPRPPGYIPEPGQDRQDRNIEIEVEADGTINSAPWSVRAEIRTDKSVRQVRFMLDGEVAATMNSGPFIYTESRRRVDGVHQLVVDVEAADGSFNRATRQLAFGFGVDVLLLSPADNQTLDLPTNAVLEANEGWNTDQVKFMRRSPGGQTEEIAGTVTRQQIGQIYRYTLNWAQSAAPPAGSYEIFAQTPGGNSNSAVVRIQ